MLKQAKEKMIRDHLKARGIIDPAVLQAMQKTKREQFIPAGLRNEAYADRPLPLNSGQTISQPYIVALMTQLLHLSPESRVLEIGCGSGYQAAVLSEIAGEIHSVERLPELAEQARRNLDAADVTNVEVHIGDGWNGWPEAAPYDGIIVTAAPTDIPPPLLRQLKPGGRLVIPVGPAGGIQILQEIIKQPNGTLAGKEHLSVRFVPLISPHSQ
jgi:protein-L-isoaspartate(D-aspartate) O-methyltransferase